MSQVNLLICCVHFASRSRDSTEYEEHRINTTSSHPVSALCVLPPSNSEQFELIAVASTIDHVIRIYRVDETSPLYQLEGHTDRGTSMTNSLFYSFTDSFIPSALLECRPSLKQMLLQLWIECHFEHSL